MSFKYINPGYGELLDADGGITVEGSQYGKFGVAFYQPDATKGITVDGTPTALYVKFDVYLGDPAVEFQTRVGSYYYTSSNNNYVEVKKSGAYFSILVMGQTGGSLISMSERTQEAFESKTHLKFGAVNTIYYKADVSTEPHIELWCNGVKIGDRAYSSLRFFGTTIAVSATNSANGLISNLIISDGEIDRNETIALLPVSATETDMADQNDGNYAASSANQMILQSVAVQSLIDEYGETSEIRGFALVGMPAYRTGGGITRLTAIEKYNGVITEYGTKDLSENTSVGVMDCRRTALTLADMAGRQFGWKAKA